MSACARRATVAVAFAAAAFAAYPRAQEPARSGSGGPSVRRISYVEAKPVIEGLAASLPQELSRISASELESTWPRWVSRRDSDIRARLARGEDDTVINFLLFGTSFTRLPRALNDSTSLGGPRRAAEIVRDRVEDLVTAVAHPGSNERLHFVRAVLAQRGIDPAAPGGGGQVRRYLLEGIARTSGETREQLAALESAKAAGRGELAIRSSLFRARGLSSDTSIRPDFAIDQAIRGMAARRLIETGSVRRVAVIGPGLDLADKAEGYDFYPPQMTQPFAIADTLVRLGLVSTTDLRVTAFDVSARVRQHVQDARMHAGKGSGYTIVLPRGGVDWHADLNRFWSEFGAGVGAPAPAPAPPPGAQLDVRAVRIRPDVVSALGVRDVNVVLERLELPERERFDLVVATNILVYYDLFEQSLALANIASMLRPGGILLSNNVLVELPAIPMRSIGHTTISYSDRTDDGDQVIWYRRN